MMCCACGGGVLTDESDWLEKGTLCRSSDYRTVASDPDFDVFSVSADIDDGYHILM